MWIFGGIFDFSFDGLGCRVYSGSSCVFKGYRGFFRVFGYSLVREDLVGVGSYCSGLEFCFLLFDFLGNSCGKVVFKCRILGFGMFRVSILEERWGFVLFEVGDLVFYSNGYLVCLSLVCGF